jgi:hypothetical protein
LVTIVIASTTSIAQQQVAREITLQVPPKGERWGIFLPTVKGKLKVVEGAKGSFSATLVLEGLTTGDQYLITLNGKAGSPGNSAFKKVAGNERYDDIGATTAQANGSAKIDLFHPLPPGSYDIKFFVKTKVGDEWKVVLYTDFLKFTVR